MKTFKQNTGKLQLEYTVQYSTRVLVQCDSIILIKDVRNGKHGEIN